MTPETTTEQLVTAAELAAMMDLGPCELVDGVIVPMSPTGDEHAIYELNTAVQIRSFVKEHNLGKVGTGEVGIYIRRNPDTVRAADVIFISNERYAQKGSSAFLDVAPDLVVEVMSPNDSFSSFQQKIRDYFSIGVRLLWILDPEVRSVFVYRAPTELREIPADGDLDGEDVLPGFRVAVAQLFEL